MNKVFPDIEQLRVLPSQLAAMLEYITASVDMRSRRMAPFPEELASGLDRLIEKHRRLSWAAPVCGLMNP
jgi:acyl-CoA thioester hydrolase